MHNKAPRQVARGSTRAVQPGVAAAALACLLLHLTCRATFASPLCMCVRQKEKDAQSVR